MKAPWPKIKLGRSEILVLTILVLGAGLRLWGSWLPFIHNAADIVPIARDISFNPRHVCLPLYGGYHGPLLVYASRLSSLIFGQSPFGWQFATVFFSTLTLPLLYLLVKDGLSQTEALLAMAVLAFNPVHIFYSKYNIEHGLLLFLGTLLLFCFWKALRLDSRGWMLASGIVFGLAMITHLSILFVIPGLAFFVFFSKGYWKWLKRKEIYLALLISLAIFSPYLFWGYTRNWPHHPHRAALVELFRFSGKAFNLFLGSFFFIGGKAYKTEFGYEYMDHFSGMVLLMGVFYSTVKLRDNFIRMVYLVFWSVAGVSLLFVRGEARHFLPALIAASVLASTALGSLWRWEREKGAQYLVIGALVLMCIIASFATYKFGEYWVPHSTICVPDDKGWVSIDMTTLSKGLIEVIGKYQPTLVVLPGKNLGAAGPFMEAYSGWKVVSSKRQHRWRKVYPEDLKKVVIILVPGVKGRRYKKWAERHNLKMTLNKQETMIASRRFQGREESFSWPVRILVFEKEEQVKEKAGEELMNLLVSLN